MFVLYGRGSRPSARLLAEALGVDFGREVPPHVNEVVRWGTSKTTHASTLLNSAEAIRRTTDKFGSMTRFKEAGLTVASFSEDPHSSCLTWPIIGRMSYHRGGTDILLYLQRKDLESLGPSDYYVSFIPKAFEYRVHVFGGRCVKLSRKVFEVQPRRRRRYAVAWNYKAGYRFISRDESTPSISFFANLAIPAVRSLGLDFGAVDLFTGEGGKTYITEVNTAPGLKHTADVYARNILRLLS